MGNWSLEVGVWKLEFGIWNWLLRISHCELRTTLSALRPSGETLRPLFLCGKKSLRLRSAATLEEAAHWKHRESCILISLNFRTINRYGLKLHVR